MKIKDLTLGQMQTICDTTTCKDCEFYIEIEGVFTNKICLKELVNCKEEINTMLNSTIDVPCLKEIKKEGK